MQSKTSETVEIQLPLKGFHAPYVDPETKREMTIEGMGDGRYRIKALKRPPKGK